MTPMKWRELTTVSRPSHSPKHGFVESSATKLLEIRKVEALERIAKALEQIARTR